MQEQQTHMRDSLASERVFIGVVLNGQTRATDHNLQPDDFTTPELRRLFSICAQLEAQGKQADLVTVFDATSTDADANLIVQLSGEAAVSGSLIDQLAENIRTAAQRRNLVNVCAELIRGAQDATKPLDEEIARARIALDVIGAEIKTDDVITGTDALVDFYTWLPDGDKEPPIGTGLTRLDQYMNGGFRGGRLVVIGARPAVGKSALLSSITVNALRTGRKALYISREMAEREIVSRMTSELTGVTQGKIEGHTLSDGDYEAVYKLGINGDNLWISTKAGTPAAIRRLALQMKAAGGCDLVCVDYLQLLHADGKCSSRVEEMSEISRALKLLALELRIPVIAAAQVNRLSTVGVNRPPALSELRESGSIKQDADIVLMMHAPSADGDEQRQRWEQTGKRPIQLFIAKNRSGRTGKLDLMFEGCRMRFLQVDERRTPT